MSTQETTTREEMTTRRGPQPRRKVVQMVVVGVIASILGIALGLSIHWFPPADSTQADKIDTLWDVLIVATVPIFVLVVTVVLFSTAHRSTGTRGSRCSGRPSRRCSSSASSPMPTSC